MAKITITRNTSMAMMTMGMPTDKATISCLLSSLRGKPAPSSEAPATACWVTRAVPNRQMTAHGLVTL